LTSHKGLVTVLALVIGLLLVGGAYAAVGGGQSAEHANPASQVSTEVHGSEQPEGEGVHGGPQARIHTGCTLATGLTGNWTHGDYVSAVAEAHQGDSDVISEAAQSDCGKVDHETGDGPHGQSGAEHGKSGLPHGKSADHRPENAGS
jgi:hypothetical protein